MLSVRAREETQQRSDAATQLRGMLNCMMPTKVPNNWLVLTPQANLAPQDARIAFI